MPGWLAALLIVATVLALLHAAFDAGWIAGARDEARRRRP